MRRFAAVLFVVALPVQADPLRVAVAANFMAPLKAIGASFERQSGHKVLASFGATGKFYAQIRAGAPFAVLLAADEATPARLEQEQVAIAGTRFTYAIGQLVLWSAQPGLVDDKGAVLNRGQFAHLALANPKLAPYGAAAVQVLHKLGLHDALAPKFVLGESVAQAHQFVASGAAPLGFVALSQVMEGGRLTSGSAWMVPPALHAPIRQDALLLAAGKDQPAAAAFLRFLRSEPARQIIAAYGYALPAP